MSLRLKTILGIGLIEAILLIILISTAISHMRSAGKESLEDYVKTTSTLFATITKDAMLSFDIAALDSLVDELLLNKNILFVRIFDSEDTVLSQGGDPELLHRIYTIDNSMNDVDDGIFNLHKKIAVDGISYGHIEIGISTQSIEESLSATKKLVGSIAIIEMLLVAMFSYALGAYLTRQLKTLRRSAKAIAEGDLEQKIPIISRDEIAEVSQAFNKMVGSLKEAEVKRDEYQNELLLINEELESRVDKRTRQLLLKNKELETAYDELKNTQEQLIHAEKLASIGQLAAGVAHEINNPIGFIKGNLSALNGYTQNQIAFIEQFKEISDLIANNADASEQIQKALAFYEDEDLEFINEDIPELVNESIKGVDRIKDIVQALKVYAGDSQAQWQQCSINQCIENALQKIEGNEFDHCTVENNTAHLPDTYCNAVQITQAFNNIILNAAQAIETRGSIAIDSTIQDQTIAITITDTGVGIKEEHLGKVFDPFFTTKAVGEGTGLGLSIAEGIISSHRGEIKVASQWQQGARVTISLPINDQQAESSNA